MLSNPPEKSTQETHQAFWGEYRWPYQKYQRYKVCAGLEKTADESRSMTAAFSNLTQVTELALSMDSGLGWLCGPDISDRARIFNDKGRVFGSKSSIVDARRRQQAKTWEILCGQSSRRAVLSKQVDFLRHTSFPSSKAAIRPAMNSNPPTAQKNRTLDNISNNRDLTANGNAHLRQHGRLDRESALQYENILYAAAFQEMESDVEGQAADGEAEDEDTNTEGDENEDENLDNQDWTFAPGSSHPEINVKQEAPPLFFGGVELPLICSTNTCATDNSDASEESLIIPKALSPAQKELLLETEWAQRAFLASYTLAVIDNKNISAAVHTLNIAALSSRHISSLRRHDLWRSLPNLRTLVLNISPDWRDVAKENGSFVATPAIYPTAASTALGAFLQDFISHLKSVRNLGLGWLGGGEHATGLYARNQNICLAPLGGQTMVHLPYVRQLTISNCWFYPDQLSRFVKRHQKTLLGLKLDSVSLTAPRASQPPTVPVFHPFLPSNTDMDWEWLFQGHRSGSWPDVIESITPGLRLAQMRDAHRLKPKSSGSRPKVSLKRIEFQSCGYARLGTIEGYDQFVLQSAIAYEMPPALKSRKIGLEPYMMQTPDNRLGQIVPHIKASEMETMRQAWNMREGWGSDLRRFHNLEDGQPVGGTGRFTGFVERVQDPWEGL